MAHHILGQSRTQTTLFPEVLDDFVTEDNPVQVIDVFVEGLDLEILGFEGVIAKAKAKGRPGYHPDIPVLRKQTVEHPFGTIKMWMGATHFLMRRKKNVSIEMSLNVLAYNLKRMMTIMGITGLMEAMMALGCYPSKNHMYSLIKSHYSHPEVTQRPHLLFQLYIRHINSGVKDVTEAAAD